MSFHDVRSVVFSPEESDASRVNRENLRKALKATVLSAIVISMAAMPIMIIAGVPVVQSLEQVLPGAMTTLTGATGGMFIVWEIEHWGSYPSQSAWYNFLLTFGIGYQVASLLASILAYAGVVDMAVAVGALTATGVGVAFAGAIVTF
ncbi:MAG: hypothetical protein B2I17_05840 [Thermoplasmatales archaeon B_DKE]|nr:MAG: hypothetical protein B2I17_05840 [Thermoplasmatales archaeon B_DKE]